MLVHRHRFHLFFAYVCPKTEIAVAVSSVTARLSVSFGILMKFIIFQKQRIISAVTFLPNPNYVIRTYIKLAITSF